MTKRNPKRTWLLDTEGNPEWMLGFGDYRPDNEGILPSSSSEAHSALLKGYWACPENRRKQSERCKASHRNHDPAVNAKRSETLKRVFDTEEHRKAKSARSLALWQNPEHRKNVGSKRAIAWAEWRLKKSQGKR